MKKWISAAFLFTALWACNETGDSNHSDTTDTMGHSGHGTTQSEAATGSNPMKAMHDAMSKMENDMKSMQPTGDADYDFAMMMKHHHQSAVDMANAEISGGKDTAMLSLATKMKADQQAEIAQLDSYIQSAGTPKGSSTYGQLAMGMMTPMSSIKMESSSLDAMFASMMIPHHQDAVKMAQAYLKETKNESLKKMAQAIISEQQNEINTLQNWLQQHKN